MKIKSIAMLCHEVNRAYCESIGDFSQPEWENAPEWQKDSCVMGVRFHIGKPNAKPSDSHESWLKTKKADGWKYGPVKDVDKKEHPCCVPYEDLPSEHKTKDYIFSAIVKTLSNSN